MGSWGGIEGVGIVVRIGLGYTILLMDKILHYFKYPKLWELWYIPYNG